MATAIENIFRGVEDAYEDENTGALVAEYEDERPKSDPNEHGANLAESMEEDDLRFCAYKLIEAFERDRGARSSWDQRFAKGLELVGVIPTPSDDVPFEGANTVVYPLIAEAQTQFVARAIEEIFPASGPVKAIVAGPKTQDREERASRVEDFMNYQITEMDPGWYDEDERLLAHLPIYGMGYKKVYFDERERRVTSRFVPAMEVFAPYSATTTHSIPRICHCYEMQRNDARFEQLSGRWRDVRLAEPSEGDEESDVQAAQDEADSLEPGDQTEDRPHKILEFYVDYDLPGFEHAGDTGEPTGFALPYVIVIEQESQVVLEIRRNWREGDESFRRRINLIPFRFLPGLGFYGWGFLHVIGGLAEASTSALRALLDSAGRQNSQGGFISSDLRIKTGSEALGMGEWRQVDASAEEMARGFFSPPWHPPSDALFKLLQMLLEAGKSYTSTTEAMTGSAPSTGPVGTMVALIEQGSKVFSGIHKRLHKAKRDEYRLLAEIDAEHIPEDGYPYLPGNEDRVIFAQDFGPEVDVLPVSDPNIYSAQQKIAIAQAGLELANAAPDIYDRREAHRRVHEAMKTPDIDGLLKPEQDPVRQDPVTENMGFLNGEPAKAFPDQEHDAHIQAHLTFMSHPGFGGNPQVQKLIGPIVQAHLGEHLGFLYRQMMLQAAGLPYVPTADEMGHDPEQHEGLPPEIENEIAVRAAMASALFLEMQSGLPTAPAPDQESGDDGKLAADQAKAEMQIESQRRDAAHKAASAAAEEERKQQEHDAQQERKRRDFQADQHRKALKAAEQPATPAPTATAQERPTSPA